MHRRSSANRRLFAMATCWVIRVAYVCVVAVALLACQQNMDEERRAPAVTVQPGGAALAPSTLPPPSPSPVRPTPAAAVVPSPTAPASPTPAVRAFQAAGPTLTPMPPLVPTPTAELLPTATPTKEEILAMFPTVTPTVEELLVSLSTRMPPLPSATVAPVRPEVVASTELAELVPWYADPQGGIHRTAADALTELWVADEYLGWFVATFPWVVDGMTRNENTILEILAYHAQRDVSLAFRLIDLEWLADGIDMQEFDGPDTDFCKRAHGCPCHGPTPELQMGQRRAVRPREPGPGIFGAPQCQRSRSRFEGRKFFCG